MKKHLILAALIISSTVFNASFAMEEIEKNIEEKAEKGHVVSMMDVSFLRAGKCLNGDGKEHCEAFLLWHSRLLVRIHQDDACKVTRKLTLLGLVYNMRNTYSDLKRIIIDKGYMDQSDFSRRNNRIRIAEAIEWAHQKTENDELPSAYELLDLKCGTWDISGYEKKSCFLHPRYWKKMRENTLDEVFYLYRFL